MNLSEQTPPDRPERLERLPADETEPSIMLRERAYQEIKRLLFSPQALSEPFLSQRKLARQLGIGNTPVRSAIERLENEGLILISPQQGIAVRELRTREIADHYEIRQALEPYIMRRITGRLTAEQEQRVRRNLAAQEEATANNDLPQIILLDTEYHLLFCAFLDNQEIYRTMLQLRDKIHRVIMRMARVSPERFAVSFQEHRDIAEAVFAGEADRAASLIFDHLELGKQKLLPGGNW
jgi:DNA-binding GntR family transcriptional regulator